MTPGNGRPGQWRGLRCLWFLSVCTPWGRLLRATKPTLPWFLYLQREIQYSVSDLQEPPGTLGVLLPALWGDRVVCEEPSECMLLTWAQPRQGPLMPQVHGGGSVFPS